MAQKKKLSKYLIVSGLIHVLIALAISGLYAEQPKKHRRLEIVGSVKIQYKEPEPPPKPKVVTRVQPEKKVALKEKEPKITSQKVSSPKAPQQTRRRSASAPGLAMEKAPQRSKSAPGVVGVEGTRGSTGDLPGMPASGGVYRPDLTTTKTGSSGLLPGRTHGSMEMPTGSAPLPGAGGKAVAGFKTGVSQTGSGIGRVDISKRSESGGTGMDGPGASLSAVTGRAKVGGGKETTGLGVGASDGMGEIESDPTGGGGAGGGDTGPGIGSSGSVGARSGPSLTTGAGIKTGDKELPATKELPEEKRVGATGKKEFKAKLGKGMTSVTPHLDEEPSQSGFDDALQGEINRNLYSLRKVYEDWQNLKVSNIPKALRITIELGMEKDKPKLLKVNFHSATLSPRIKDDLTKKIKEWEFKSLYDGKDDPEKWPIKLTGRISWQ